MNPLAADLIRPAFAAGLSVNGITRYRYGHGYKPVENLNAAAEFQTIEIVQDHWKHPMLGGRSQTIIVCTRTGDAHTVGILGDRIPITIRDARERLGLNVGSRG